MKKLLLVFCVFVGSTAFATVPTKELLLEKTSVTGYVKADWANSESCEIYSNGEVIVSRTFGGNNAKAFTTKEVKKIEFSGEFTGAMEAAKVENLRTFANNLCDGPSTRVVGYLNYETGGCGSPRKNREGGTAEMLRRFIGSFCPQTN
jgi:hypothetical protein